MWQGPYRRNVQKGEIDERKYANSAYVVIILVHLWNRHQGSFEYERCVSYSGYGYVFFKFGILFEVFDFTGLTV